MTPKPESESALDKVVLLFLFALFLLISPLVEWWAADDSPWYLPYLLWLGLIGLGFWRQRQGNGP